MNLPARTISATQRVVHIPLRELSMLAALAGIVAFFVIYGYATTGRADFLSPRNLSLLSIDLAITGVLAAGMLVVILLGQIDLAAGSGVGLFGGLAAMLVTYPAGVWVNLIGADAVAATGGGWPAALALVSTSFVAVILYSGVGALVIYQRVPAFIVTLGGLLVLKGLHWKVIRNATIPVAPGGSQNLYSLLTTYYLPPAAAWAIAITLIALMAIAAWRSVRIRRRELHIPVDAEYEILRWLVAAQLVTLLVLVTNQFRGVPLAVLILAAVVFGVHVLTRLTRFGRYVYAIGGNEDAARLSGVPVETITIAGFALMGLIVSLAGYLQTAYAGASTTTIGSLMELDAIAACVIGGASLRGGRGNVVGVLFGALIMAVLLNGMTLLAVSPENKQIARGAVLVLAVWLDVYLGRRQV